MAGWRESTVNAEDVNCMYKQSCTKCTVYVDRVLRADLSIRELGDVFGLEKAHVSKRIKFLSENTFKLMTVIPATLSKLAEAIAVVKMSTGLLGRHGWLGQRSPCSTVPQTRHIIVLLLQQAVVLPNTKTPLERITAGVVAVNASGFVRAMALPICHQHAYVFFLSPLCCESESGHGKA